MVPKSAFTANYFLCRAIFRFAVPFVFEPINTEITLEIRARRVTAPASSAFPGVDQVIGAALELPDLSCVVHTRHDLAPLDPVDAKFTLVVVTVRISGSWFVAADLNRTLPLGT